MGGGLSLPGLTAAQRGLPQPRSQTTLTWKRRAESHSVPSAWRGLCTPATQKDGDERQEASACPKTKIPEGYLPHFASPVIPPSGCVRHHREVNDRSCSAMLKRARHVTLPASSDPRSPPRSGSSSRNGGSEELRSSLGSQALGDTARHRPQRPPRPAAFKPRPLRGWPGACVAPTRSVLAPQTVALFLCPFLLSFGSCVC